jgi:hypothetical protein
VEPYFRVPKKTAKQIIEHSETVEAQGSKIAARLRIPAREQERMTPAFRLAQ